MRQTFVYLFAFMVILSLSTAAKRPPPDPPKLAAAQICRPYFRACMKARGREHVSYCFTNFSRNCYKKLHAGLVAMEACVKEGGDNLEAANECIIIPSADVATKK